jgi:error-prone DNA polymerase
MQPFADIDDFHNRVPELRKDEMRKLAQVGALNFIGGQRSEVRGQRSEVNPQSAIRNPQSVNRQSAIDNRQFLHRRSALWKAERATRPVGPLLKDQREQVIGNSEVADPSVPYNLSPVPSNLSPLRPMTIEERVNADFHGTGVTIGRHPMAYRREELNKLGIKRAVDLPQIRDGQWVRVAGWVIVRQRPGTAKGFLFLTMEDETGISNVIVTPDTFDRNRSVLVNQPLLLIEGPLQNQDNVIHVRARHIQPLSYAMTAAASHDFH